MHDRRTEVEKRLRVLGSAVVSLNSRKVLCILTRTSEDFLLGILLVEASFIFFFKDRNNYDKPRTVKKTPALISIVTHTHILYRHIIEQQGTAYSFKRSERNNHIF